MLAPTEVQIADGLHLVERPTVRQAITVMVATEADGDESYAARIMLSRALYPWLGLGVASRLLSRSMDRERRDATLMRLLRIGLTGIEDAEKKLADVEERAERTSWIEMVAIYARNNHLDPEAALDQLWPVFVEFFAQIPRLRALDQRDEVEVGYAVKTGKADGIFERARLSGDRKSKSTFVEPDIMKDPTWIRRQKETAARLAQQARDRMGNN